MGEELCLDWRSFLLRPEPDPSRTLEAFREYTLSWRRPAAEEPAAVFRTWATDEGPPSHSVPPHLVAKAAARLGPEPFRRTHERLLRAYFTENRDITTERVLRELWSELELPESAFDEARDPALVRQVVDEHNEALVHGTTGVPAARLADGESVLMGAHPTATYRTWIRKILAASAP